MFCYSGCHGTLHISYSSLQMEEYPSVYFTPPRLVSEAECMVRMHAGAN